MSDGLPAASTSVMRHSSPTAEGVGARPSACDATIARLRLASQHQGAFGIAGIRVGERLHLRARQAPQGVENPQIHIRAADGAPMDERAYRELVPDDDRGTWVAPAPTMKASRSFDKDCLVVVAEPSVRMPRRSIGIDDRRRTGERAPASGPAIARLGYGRPQPGPRPRRAPRRERGWACGAVPTGGDLGLQGRFGALPGPFWWGRSCPAPSLRRPHTRALRLSVPPKGRFAGPCR